MQTSIQLKPYGYIYKITNPVNNKCYIGQTINDPKFGRWCDYKKLRACKGQPKLYNALKKYGPDNFIYEIIEIGFNKANLDFLEDIYEILCNSIENGYNVKRGGANGNHSHETKLKISNIQKGRIVTEETRRKISKANKGRKMSEAQNKVNSEVHKGINVSDIAKQKISKSLKGKIFSLETRLKLSNALKGHRLSEITKQKISDTLSKKSF